MVQPSAFGALPEVPPANRFGSLTPAQVRAVRRMLGWRWLRAIVGRLLIFGSPIVYLWLDVRAAHVALLPYLPYFAAFGLLAAVVLVSASRRLLNLRGLAHAPVLMTEGPIIVTEPPWGVVGQVFTVVNPYEYRMHLLPGLRGTFDLTSSFRLYYLKLRHTPDMYFVVSAERLGPAAEEDVRFLQKFYDDITPRYRESIRD
jgi:hypothetical protein